MMRLVKLQKRIQADFFKTDMGNKPVRDFLKSLASDDKKLIGSDIMAVEMAWPIGYPKVRKLRSDLWELRTDISDKRICRFYFTIHKNKMVLLHAFIKKTQKTPLEDLYLATRRKNLVLGSR